MKTRWFVTVLAVPALAVGAAQAQRFELIHGAAPPPTAGEAMYKTYCASCHGDGGRGDGAMSAVLATRPADLTALSGSHSEGFPRLHVIATIRCGHADGTQDSAMPDWGPIFRLVVDPNNPQIVALRARALTDYIESMQQR